MHENNRVARLVALALCGVIAVPVFAQEEGGFDVADSNFDGQISKRELKRYVSKRVPGFTLLDALMSHLDIDASDSLSELEFANREKVLADLKQRWMQKSAHDSVDRPGSEKSQTASPVVEFAEHYEKIFAAEDPQVGEKISNISAFDGDGNALQLGELNGRYAVLVFGCLT